nr:YetF domain-containing protein [Schaalia sp. Marseille-Q2122]
MLGGIISGIIYNSEIPFHRFVLVLLIAIGMISLLNFITMRFLSVRQAVTSDPLPIIVNGVFQVGTEEGGNAFDIITFISQLRARGIYSLEDIAFAQVEPDGSLTVIKKGEGVINTLLVRHGQILHNYLEAIERDEAWLMGELAEEGLELDDVYIVEFSREKHLFIVKKDGSCIAKEI